jgi:hypothetical protein
MSTNKNINGIELKISALVWLGSGNNLLKVRKKDCKSTFSQMKRFFCNLANFFLSVNQSELAGSSSSCVKRRSEIKIKDRKPNIGPIQRIEKFNSSIYF